jgi:hypothetical protein
MFVSTMLVAVGLAIWMRVVRMSGLFHWVLDFPVCFIAAALLGAGALIPFKGAWLGAFIGLSLSGFSLAVTLFG